VLQQLVSTETTMKLDRVLLYGFVFYHCAGKLSPPFSLAVIVIAIISLQETKHPEGLKFQTKPLSSTSKPQKKPK